jgi:hypothetical protein
VWVAGYYPLWQTSLRTIANEKAFSNFVEKAFSARDWNRTSTSLRTADPPAGRQVLSVLHLPVVEKSD